MRELLPLALLAFACGTALGDPLGCARASPAVRAPAEAPSAASATSTAQFAALAARGPAVAPGMREVARNETSGEKMEIVQAGEHDACVRVAFEASAPVVARLVDGEGHVLASSDAPATNGVLGQRGPVCVRKGDAVSVVAEGSATSVRWIAWEAP